MNVIMCHIIRDVLSYDYFNLLCANPVKWSNILKQFVGKLPTNCLSVLDYFVGLALKGLFALIYPFLTNVLLYFSALNYSASAVVECWKLLK